jgi:hypothetical protein
MAKLTGLMQDAQIAAVAASKITGQVGDPQISGMAVAKLIGQILNAQIQSISATKLSDQVQDAQIAALSSSKLIGIKQVSSIGTHITTNQVISAVYPNYVLIQMGAEDWDVLGEYNPSTYIFTAQETGKYLINLAVSHGGSISSGNSTEAYVFKNGSFTPSNILIQMPIGPVPAGESASRIVSLNAGDYLGVYSLRSSTGASWTVYGAAGGTESPCKLSILRVA